jgi:hypothetical protein
VKKDRVKLSLAFTVVRAAGRGVLDMVSELGDVVALVRTGRDEPAQIETEAKPGLAFLASGEVEAKGLVVSRHDDFAHGIPGPNRFDPVGDDDRRRALLGVVATTGPAADRTSAALAAEGVVAEAHQNENNRDDGETLHGKAPVLAHPIVS